VIREIQSVGLIGGGNMGEAIMGAMIRSGLYQASQIVVSDISPERLDILKKTYGVNITKDNQALFVQCDIVIVAVKPQVIEDVLWALFTSLFHPEGHKLLISIAAGIPLQKLEQIIYRYIPADARRHLPIIRVMPNTPALVLEGMSGMSLNEYALIDDKRAAEKILGSMGSVHEFEEAELDAVTALSGSGPAYVFYLAEAMIEAGIRLELTPEASTLLTLKTMKGALKLMEESDASPETLRQKVMSPGGTTEAAIKIMELNDVKRNIIEAIQAAAKRSKTLSQSQ
jgi:pyrroline-5-carboxylate reductase